METGNEWSDEEIDIYDNLSDEDCNQQETSQEAEQTFITSERHHLIMIYGGSRLYQESLTDVVNEGNIVLYSEESSTVGRDQIYDRETVEGHNHRPEPLQAEVDVVVDKALQLAKQSPLATNRSIIAAVLANVSDGGRFGIDTVRLGKRIGLFKQPYNSDAWKVHVDSSAFVIYDSGLQSGANRCIVMSSLFIFEQFAKCNSVAMDGSFFSRPDGWRQYYVLHMRLRNTYIPAVAVFMGSKSEDAYMEMLQAIGGCIREYFGLEWTINEVMSDFEQAIRNAMRRYFGMCSRLNIVNVSVLENPLKLDQPFKVEITFEAFEDIKEEVEWELLFVASDGKEEHDQILDSILIGPIREGRHKFVFDAPPPDVTKLSAEDMTDVTVLLLKCKYRDQLFVKIGWFITHGYNKETDPELADEPPAQPVVEKLQRSVLTGDIRVTYYAIKWDDDPPQEEDDEDAESNTPPEMIESLTLESQDVAME
uniref:MULE transposase domain-containing protein n=1 Tax=Ditylenchus dipsaci TaxID=166011 RepID=A0A915DFL2_9BILA